MREPVSMESIGMLFSPVESGCRLATAFEPDRRSPLRAVERRRFPQVRSNAKHVPGGSPPKLRPPGPYRAAVCLRRWGRNTRRQL